MQSTLRTFLGALALAAWSLTLPAAEAPAEFKVSDLIFKRPAQWEWVHSTSAMRKAQLKVPAEGSEGAEVVFFHFGPGSGGGTKANIDRWFRQFKEGPQGIQARTEETRAGARTVTYALAQGTYLSGLPGGPQTPKPGFALVGAIIEDPAGSVFVRMTGPRAVVEKATPEFKKMIEGAR